MDLNKLLEKKTVLLEELFRNLHEEKNLRLLTEMKLKESEDRFTQFIECFPNAILVYQRGKIIYTNLKTVELIGAVSIKDIVGRDRIDFVHPKYRKEYLDRINKEEVNFTALPLREERFYKLDGKLIEVEVASIPFLLNGSPAYQDILTDITNRKINEMKLLKSKAEAEEANKTKSILINNISHELRTPLNAILGFTQLLSDIEEDKELSEIIEKITFSGKRLLHSLNLIQTSTDLESKDFATNYSEVDLPLLCTYIKSFYQSQAAEKNLKLELAIAVNELRISCDEYLLSNILSNIVENAIKFTKKGSVRIELKNNIQYGGKEFALISVKDTGIGIREEDYESIFREFKQVSEGFQRNFEGLGLGLSLAYKMAKLLDIKILVDSEFNQGSNFSIMVPLSKDNRNIELKSASHSNQSSKLTSQEPTDKNHLKILLVEDNLIYIQSLEKLLKKIGDISSVRNGEEAINNVKESNYDLLLIDINLGEGIDGMEVLKQIRQMNSYKKTPSIAITGYTSEGNKEKFLNSGFTKYLAKPIERKELIDAINEVVKMN